MIRRGIIILLMLLFLTACTPTEENKPQLNYPQDVQLVEKLLSWTVVENAAQYIIVLNGEEIFTVNNFFDLDDFEDGAYNVKIKAIADGYQDSLYSVPIVFVFDEIIQAPDIEIIGSTVVWNQVPDATSYIVQINDVETETSETQIELSDFDVDSNYNIKVKAKKNGKTSRYSKEINYQTYQNINDTITIDINKNTKDSFEEDITDWELSVSQILDKDYVLVKTNEVFIDENVLVISKSELFKLDYGIQPLLLVTDGGTILLNLRIYDDRVPYFIRGLYYDFNNENKDIRITMDLYDEEIIKIEGNNILSKDYQINDNEIVIFADFISAKFVENISAQTLILHCVVTQDGNQVRLPFYINRR